MLQTNLPVARRSWLDFHYGTGLTSSASCDPSVNALVPVKLGCVVTLEGESDPIVSQPLNIVDWQMCRHIAKIMWHYEMCGNRGTHASWYQFCFSFSQQIIMGPFIAVGLVLFPAIFFQCNCRPLKFRVWILPSPPLHIYLWTPTEQCDVCIRSSEPGRILPRQVGNVPYSTVSQHGFRKGRGGSWARGRCYHSDDV